jgi:hypothetical protein
MNRKLFAAVAAGLLALGAGVALAATQTSAVTSACVNDTNGLMRAADACRDGEHRVPIGGGGAGGTAVTENGSFTVPAGSTGGGKTLPLTGVTVSGRCETFASPFGSAEGFNARVLVEAPAGKTMDFYPADFNASPTGVTSRLLPPVASLIPGMGTSSLTSVGGILTVNGATATLTTGGSVDADARTCTFLWQAVESPN